MPTDTINPTAHEIISELWEYFRHNNSPTPSSMFNETRTWKEVVIAVPTERVSNEKAEKLIASLTDAAEALDHAVLWIEDYAIPAIQRLSGDDDVDGGNSLAAGLTMKSEEIRDLIDEIN